jgi:DNA recombination protein RmuC
VEDNGLAAAILEYKVVPVSPSSLFLYIQTVAYGLRGFNFSKKAEKLLSYLYEVQTELAAFDKTVSTAGTHLKNLTRSFDALSIQSRRIDTLVKRIEKP